MRYKIVLGLVVCLCSCLLSAHGSINPDWNHMPRALKLWWKGSIGQEGLLERPWPWCSAGSGSLSFPENRAGKRQCHVCNREQGWLVEAALSCWGKPAGQEHPKHLRGAGSCLAASAASWIVCCWKGDHQSSACLWNLLHGISFTLARKSAPEKDQENTFSLIKSCCQMPSVGWCLIHQWYRRRKQFYEVWLLTIFIIWVDFLW